MTDDSIRLKAKGNEAKRLGRLGRLSARAWNALPTPPEWIGSATYIIASRLKHPAVVPGEPAYRVAQALVWGALIVYAAVVLVCMMRVLAAMFIGTADDINKLLLALGGVVGGPFLIWRTFIAHQQTNIAREGHYTSLFTKAVEQLGATREVKGYQDVDEPTGTRREATTATEPNLEVRLGAIYALDRISRDSERDHWPIMEVLCAYVRNPQNSGMPTKWEDEDGETFRDRSIQVQSIKAPRVDIQAALSVIGRRAKERIKFELNKGLRLDLREANLQKAIFAKGDFTRANFDGTYLDGASFIEAMVDRSSFDGAKLLRVRFSKASLVEVSFFDAALDGASFGQASLDRSSFDSASLNKCRFLRTRASEVSFEDANLAGASFISARLENASFLNAALKGADFGNAKLKGTRLFKCDLSKVTNLNSEELSVARGDASTILPMEMGRPSR